MARRPAQRESFELEILRITAMIRAVEADTRRGAAWKSATLEVLRRARAKFEEAPVLKKAS